MSKRATIKDLEEMTERVQEQLRILGLIPRESVAELSHGSPSAGRAWRLYHGESPYNAVFTINGVDALPTGWPSMGVLGWTKGEAMTTLLTVHAELSDRILSEGLKFGEYKEHKASRI